jgi:hypothetical protein
MNSEKFGNQFQTPQDHNAATENKINQVVTTNFTIVGN